MAGGLPRGALAALETREFMSSPEPFQKLNLSLFQIITVSAPIFLLFRLAQRDRAFVCQFRPLDARLLYSSVSTRVATQAPFRSGTDGPAGGIGHRIPQGTRLRLGLLRTA